MDSTAWDKISTYILENRELFEIKEAIQNDKKRGEKFSIDTPNLFFDFSKNIISEELLDLLVEFAEEKQLSNWQERMFAGDKINHTEKRSVLHSVMRFPEEQLKDHYEDVLFERKRVFDFVNKVHQGELLGATGKKINSIINIGIGGSHLGPEMAVNALSPYAKEGIENHFIANLDSDYIEKILSKINIESSLFIICSKSFSTQETIENAKYIKEYFSTYLDEDKIKHHFIAVSNNTDAAKDFGIAAENIFPMWDWVGGRYSVWSAVGISLALAIGVDNYKEFLLGAYEADTHFQKAPLKENIPVIMALLGILYRNAIGVQSHSVVPYSENLSLLVNYLQQADMESNGKSVNREGEEILYGVGPIIWGGTGTNSQHAFFQHLHQATSFTPVDFIAFAKPVAGSQDMHNILLANCLSQSMALAVGKEKEAVKEELKAKGVTDDDIDLLTPYKTFKGNRPSSVLLMEKLTPKSLGYLLATYENKIFVQGVIWNINSFDQMGVELGKELADEILPILDGGGDGDITSVDYSTKTIIKRITQYE